MTISGGRYLLCGYLESFLVLHWGGLEWVVIGVAQSGWSLGWLTVGGCDDLG